MGVCVCVCVGVFVWVCCVSVCMLFVVAMCLMHSNIVLKDSESLASEVADSLQEVMAKLSFSRVEVIAKPRPPPVEVQITPPTELDEKEDQTDGVCLHVLTPVYGVY